MTIITINKKDFAIPTEWNELSPEQLLMVMDTIYLKQYEPVKMLLKLLKVLLNVGYFRWLKIKADDLNEFLYLTGFLVQGNLNFYKQLIPVYDGYHGPADEIGNMEGGEFVFSEHYHELWWNDKNNLQALDDFVAVIYRPVKKGYDLKKDPDGDPRVPFNENVCSYLAKTVIWKWPMPVKLAIATWYAGCRQKMVNDNRDVFGGNGEAAKYGLISILRAIAEKGTYGTFEKVERMKLSLMMIEMNETVEEGKRLEEQMKQHSTT